MSLIIHWIAGLVTVRASINSAILKVIWSKRPELMLLLSSCPFLFSANEIKYKDITCCLIVLHICMLLLFIDIRYKSAFVDRHLRSFTKHFFCIVILFFKLSLSVYDFRYYSHHTFRRVLISGEEWNIRITMSTYLCK